MKTRPAVACALSALFTALLSAFLSVLPSVVLSVLLSAAATPALAHRLDEYLQAATISIAAGRVQAEMRLTPGVAVFPGVFAGMDTNGDGVLSAAEQQAYAQRVIGDLSLTLDGARLRPRLTAWRFGTIEDMKAGRGEIELAFEAGVPSGSGSRCLVFENHHQSRIAVYLVNCLVPRDPNIQVTAQKRDYRQSRYELDYVQTGVLPGSPSAAPRIHASAWPGAAALPASAPVAFLLLALLWRRRGKDGNDLARAEGAVTGESASPDSGKT